MTTVSRFSRQNDAGLRALNVVLRENLVLVVVLVLESKGPYYRGPGDDRSGWPGEWGLHVFTAYALACLRAELCGEKTSREKFIFRPFSPTLK